MKYENYDRINSIMPEIKNKEKLLEQLSDTGLSILIKAKKNIVFNIPIGFKHDMGEIGADLIDSAKKLVQSEITALKKELDTL